MACMAVVDKKTVVLAELDKHELRPTELLQSLRDRLPYQEIQDGIRELLDSGLIELGSDRRLRRTLLVAR